MTRLYIYADDSMMGREAGTPWNLKATAYIADQARRMGLQPAGERGTFFQDVPLVRSAFDSTSGLTVDGVALEPWKDFIPRDQGAPMRPLTDAPAIFAGVWGDSTMLPADQAVGKLVVVAVPPGVGPNGQPRWFVSRAAVTNRYRGAAGIAVASVDYMPPQFLAGFRNLGPQLKGAPAAHADTTPLPGYLYVTAAAGRGMFGAPLDSVKVGAIGKTCAAASPVEVKAGPERRGDPAGQRCEAQGSNVTIGAHNDHIGVDNTPVDHDGCARTTR
jgi:hypothetical protein